MGESQCRMIAEAGRSLSALADLAALYGALTNWHDSEPCEGFDEH